MPHPQVESFIDELVVNHGFDRAKVRGWFERARTERAVLRAIARPSTTRPWYVYRASYITGANIRLGVDYWERHADALARARAEFGVPEEIIVATLGIETSYGRNTGKTAVFDALATLAFAYPPRAELFRSELAEFLLLTRELRVDPLRYKGSYAGALGIAQFLPGSYRRYAIDFDHDGRRDLWNHSDAIGSVANYYKAYGWQPGERVIIPLVEPVDAAGTDFTALLERGLSPHTTLSSLVAAGARPAESLADNVPVSVFAAETLAGTRYWIALNNFYVITRYNRSINYAMAVHELAIALRRAHEGSRFDASIGSEKN
jgi:membrane-bound lytic murein transglycosylase B